MLHTFAHLKAHRDEINSRALAPAIKAAWRKLRRSPHWTGLTKEISRLAKSQTHPSTCDLHSDTVRIDAAAVTPSVPLETLCKRLIPWRIGPFDLGATTIDSEWRSYRKWQRLEPLLGSVRGLRIADVGCSNGYFLFKLAALNPELAIGFDPIERCWLQFALLQGLARLPNLAFVPAGISSIDTFPDFFDLVLCMGVIYHQRDPFSACRKLFAAVKPGGRVVLESLVIPQAGSQFLVPHERYAKMRNAWIIPTPEALATLLTRAGFRSPEIHHFGPVSTDEQRRTEWAPHESLKDFLDPNDPSKTVEGYPAPHSALVIARK
jgi:tRNA (mo5U34)-methyltransferase